MGADNKCLCPNKDGPFTVLGFIFETWQRINASLKLVVIGTGKSCHLLEAKSFPKPKVIAGYQFIKSCTWWQVFEIWYDDRCGYRVSKKHRKQVEVSPWWSVCEQSNMAATGAWKFHISAKFMTRIKCDTIFSMFLDMRNPFLLLDLKSSP